MRLRSTLKAWRLNSVYHVCSSFHQSIRDHRKVVIYKNRWMALLAALIHIPPIIGSAVLGSWIFYGHWVGAQITPLGAWDTEAILVIQFAAKVMEALIVASLATIIFTLVRREAALRQGAPLALLLTGIEFSNVSYIFSHEFVGLIKGEFGSRLRHAIFALGALVFTGIALVVAPTSATVMLPVQDWYTTAGTRVWLDTSAQELFPEILTSNNTITGSA